MNNRINTKESANFQEQKLFLIYGFYRAIISVSLILLFYTDIGLGERNIHLFWAVELIYIATNITFILALLSNWKPKGTILPVILGSDIILLQLAASSSGSASSGLETLLIVSVAAGSIFLKKPTVYFIPALATLCVLTDGYIKFLEGYYSTAEFAALGWLGSSFFITCFILQFLVQRLSLTQTIIRKKSAHAKNLEYLNTLIIERMQTGVAIIDLDYHIISANSSAIKLLGDKNIAGSPLKEVNADLYNSHLGWKNRTNYESVLELSHGGKKIKVHFLELSQTEQSASLIFIEDISKLTQHAQQLKLASLGQLTANIAHEIRNPLSAINHASQLLHEADIGDEDKRLSYIISDHCSRINHIIESIMDVSRGNASDSIQFDAWQWLNHFVEEYQNIHPYKIDLQLPQPLMIRFSQHQLRQILSNLFDNALRYSQENSAGFMLTLLGSIDHDGLPILDIIDYGPGIAPSIQAKIFEPFFTTEEKGNGLGLYICRELCEANQARLSYHCSDKARISYFRIHFSHPDRTAMI